jgi:hypothetical protein
MLSDEIRTRLAALTRAAGPPAAIVSRGKPAGRAPLSDHHVDAAEMFTTAEELEKPPAAIGDFAGPWPISGRACAV